MSAAAARATPAALARAGARTRNGRTALPPSPFPQGTAPTPGVTDERSDWRIISLDERKRRVVVDACLDDAQAHGPRDGGALTAARVAAFFDSACRDLSKDAISYADVTDAEAFYLRDFARRVKLDLPNYPIDEARSASGPVVTWATGTLIAGMTTLLAIVNFVAIPFALVLSFGIKLTPGATQLGEAVGIFCALALLDLCVAVLIKWQGRS